MYEAAYGGSSPSWITNGNLYICHMELKIRKALDRPKIINQYKLTVSYMHGDADGESKEDFLFAKEEEAKSGKTFKQKARAAINEKLANGFPSNPFKGAL